MEEWLAQVTRGLKGDAPFTVNPSLELECERSAFSGFESMKPDREYHLLTLTLLRGRGRISSFRMPRNFYLPSSLQQGRGD